MSVFLSLLHYAGLFASRVCHGEREEKRKGRNGTAECHGMLYNTINGRDVRDKAERVVLVCSRGKTMTQDSGLRHSH